MRDQRLYLTDIIEAIERIQSYTTGMMFQTFEVDLKTQDAVLRNLEVIGEAAGKISETLTERTQGVEWRKIKALRNILIHEYHGVNLEIIPPPMLLSAR
ncbi:MAG: DUF86 domain-containing protein [Bacteroidetes bacterium]|nr:DUF86 domain-containing protein [Bacteroidota bacterium]